MSRLTAADLQPFTGPPLYGPNDLGRLERLDREVLWKPFTQMRGHVEEEPLIIAEGLGSWLRDIHGRAYLDGVASLWVNVHGHGHPAILRRLREQLDHLDHSTMLGPSNAPAVELASRLIGLAPGGGALRRVFYSDSGSTAVEVALKMAFQFHSQHQDPARSRRRRFVALSNAYHGDTVGSVSVGGIDLFHGLYGPLLFPVERVPAPDPYHRAFGQDPATHEAECLTRLRACFARCGAEVAALIVEPLVQGAAGIITHSANWLRSAVEVARDHGSLVIVDEVATGFGRTGTMFACDQAQVVPDLLCLAKGISGGVLPLAATLTTEALFEGFLGSFDEFRAFFHGHSYTGNPLACAAGLGSLDAFEADGTLAGLQRRLPRLLSWLDTLRSHPAVGDIRRVGAMVGVELVADKSTGRPWPLPWRVGHRVIRAALEDGVLLRPLGNVIVLMPPLSMTQDELDLLGQVLHRAIDRVWTELRESM